LINNDSSVNEEEIINANGEKVSIRDNVESNMSYNINSSFNLMDAFTNNKLPNQIIINAHADRWNNNFIIWLYKDIVQRLKNIIKIELKKIRN